VLRKCELAVGAAVLLTLSVLTELLTDTVYVFYTWPDGLKS